MNTLAKPLLWMLLGAALCAGVFLRLSPPEQSVTIPDSPDSPPSNSPSTKTPRRFTPSANGSRSQKAPRIPKSEALKASFEQLGEKIEDGTASETEQFEFWEMVRSSREFTAMIEELELKTSGEDAAIEDRHHLAELSKLYLKSGRPSDARVTLEKGIQRHPDDLSLTKAYETLTSQYDFEEEN